MILRHNKGCQEPDMEKKIVSEESFFFQNLRQNKTLMRF